MGSISRSEEPACNPPRDGAGVSVEGRADLGLRFQSNAGDLRALLWPHTRGHTALSLARSRQHMVEQIAQSDNSPADPNPDFRRIQGGFLEEVCKVSAFDGESACAREVDRTEMPGAQWGAWG